MRYRNQAFTLIEIAIVVAIIGLIAGAVVVANNLIRNSQVQSVIEDQDRYKKAIDLFKQKYHYLPGDMPTAERFWGTDANCAAQGYSAGEAVPKTTTCNGDGNGRIDTAFESFRAWQQLANAGFVEGQYSGIQANAAAAYSMNPGTNLPPSRITGCGWMVGYIPTVNLNIAGLSVNTSTGTFLAVFAGGADKNYSPCLTPYEASNIDSKIDDGLPHTGNVTDGPVPFSALQPSAAWGVTNAIVTAHTNTCATAAETQYNATSNMFYCDPFFYMGF